MVPRTVAAAACALLVASSLAGCARSEARAEPPAEPAGSVDCRQVKCVALTFDDGPGPGTGRLLEILAAEDVHATFFMVGEQVEAHPKLARRVVAGGHEVGDHTWDHTALTGLTSEQIQDQLGRTSDVIAETTGVRPDVMRPPEGKINPIVAPLVGLPVILWSVDTLDWKHRNPDRMVDIVRDGVEPGSVVLMHDVYKTSAKAVPRIIDLLRADGYTFVTIRELYRDKPLKAGKTYRGRQKAYEKAHP